MAKEDVSFFELADLIEKDTVLAGNVLRLVNSALYSFQGTVNSVRHAVAILGLNRLRNVGLSMSVARMWIQVPGPAGWSPARFNLHSVAAGLLADLVAAAHEVEYAEGAFVAGLMHDLGKLLLAKGLPDEYAAVRRMVQAERRPWIECELEVAGISHAELSGAALERWRLPLPIADAVSRHHEPDGAGRLSWAVAKADAGANALGHAILPPAAPEDVPAEIAAVREQFEAEFEALKTFF